MFEMLNTILKNLFSGPVTRPYPAQRREPFASTRGQIKSVIENCIFCMRCQAACPANCIVVDRKEQTWSVDPYRCIVCGMCVEVCPTEAIIMNRHYRDPVKHREPIVKHQEGPIPKINPKAKGIN
ncbi:MAG: 4Fe-4S dicluster domain-containing protein [Firmicutes bacterium]|nr:4Fe-4S dicluster domain-containing protein [Bacillota bacterium]